MRGRESARRIVSDLSGRAIMSEDDPFVTATATLEVVPNGPSKFTVGLAFWSPRRVTVEVRRTAMINSPHRTTPPNDPGAHKCLDRARERAGEKERARG